MLELVDDLVGCWSEEDLNQDLEEVISQGQRPEQFTRENTGEGCDGYKDEAVNEFANDGAGDRAKHR